MSTKVTTDLIWNGAKVSKDFDLAQFKSLYQSASLVEAEAKSNVATDKGLLRQSINKQVDKNNAVIGTNVEYAPFVEFATRPHVITVKNASVLSNGKKFFGKSVNHPGTKAQPFLLPALTKNIKRIIKIFAKNGINLKWVSR